MTNVLGDKIKKIFSKPKMDIKKEPAPVAERTKIYIGNAVITDKYMSCTLDITEIAKHEDMFKIVDTGDGEKLFLNVTILPFQKGVNKFGKTHYLIIKNK